MPIAAQSAARVVVPVWPKDTMAEKIAFYGDPRGSHGVNESWFSNNVVRLVPPFKMTFAGKPVSSISFHKKCSGALIAALNDIWDACDHDQRIRRSNIPISKMRSGRARMSMNSLRFL
jgi:hypothetical protein